MSQIHIHTIGNDLVAVTDGKDGQVLTLSPGKAQEIQKLLDERRRIGKEISAKLKSAGIVSASDDEETVAT